MAKKFVTKKLGRPKNKVQTSIGSLFKDTKELLVTQGLVESKKFIPDIITFCESKDYLNLIGQGIQLRPFQRIILKVFYRGSRGNEDIFLTEEEIELCRKYGLDNKERGDVLGKYESEQQFRELVLVLGRRGGKGWLVGVIASYEALRLLECEGGNPYALYGLSSSNDISVLTIANSQGQAKLSFNEIKNKIFGSPYFSDKIGKDGIETQSIYLMTTQDRLDNIELEKQGRPLKKGSIRVEVGNSNSDALRGKQTYVLILDEVAMYKQTGGSSSGDQIYTAMTPSLNTFKRKIKDYDKDGVEILKDKYDSKIISISSPRGEEGILYQLFTTADTQPDRLAFRLPTWVVNPHLTEDSLKETNKQMTEEQFLMEFGAEFSGTGGTSFFPRAYVEACFSPRYEENEKGKAGIIYFAHLDPASSSHNYALVVLHREYFLNETTKNPDFNVVVDHIKYWHPTPETPINVDVIDDYVISLKHRYNLGMVSYDSWNSSSSIEKLKKNGIPAKMTRYNKRYKMVIYSELDNLVKAGRLKIFPHALLMREMLNLQRKFLRPSGFSVFPKSDGEVSTDDIADCIAGAAYSSYSSMSKHLPNSQLIDTSFWNGSAGGREWKGMSGPIGYGTGAQVQRNLEKCQTWKNWNKQN